jgi:hypothetical protein
VNVQQGAVVAFCNLVYPDALGSGLCVRYILPALLCLVGVPQLAVTGFHQRKFHDSQEERSFSPSPAPSQALAPAPQIIESGETGGDFKTRKATCIPSVLFNPKVERSASYPEQSMFVVRSIVGIASQIGDTAIGDVILLKIFSDLLPQLVSPILTFSTTTAAVDSKVKLFFSNSQSKPSVAPFMAGLLEIFSLLQGLLPLLSPENIRFYFFHHSTKSSSLSSSSSLATDAHAHAYAHTHAQASTEDLMNLLSLLEILPLPLMSKTDHHTQYDSDDSYDSELNTEHSHDYQTACIDYRQRCNVHIELCKVISSATAYVGPITTTDLVIPAVDQFFTKFVNTYDDMDVESDEMSLAFAIGVELFIPLAQLIGPEAFHTAVPSLNPRLELWLASCSSGEVGKSPPLPSNIRPEQTSEVEEVTAPVKDKGFFSWLTSKTTRSSPPPHKDDNSFYNSSKLFTTEITSSPQEPGPTLSNFSTERAGAAAGGAGGGAGAGGVGAMEGDQHVVQKKRRHSRGGLPNIKFSSLPLSSNHSTHSQNQSLSVSSLDRPSSGRVCSLLESPRWNESESRQSSLQNAKQQFQINRRTFRRPTVTSSGPIAAILSVTKREPEREEKDEELVERFYRESSWILGGSGRWNALKEGRNGQLLPPSLRNGPILLHNSSDQQKLSTANVSMKATKKLGPAAQISMTSPKVSVDTASEAISMFTLRMQNKHSWSFDEDNSSSSLLHSLSSSSSSLPPPSAVTILLPHSTESFLLGGSRDGRVKIWSLNSNPIKLISTFLGHVTPTGASGSGGGGGGGGGGAGVTSAGFLRNGTQCASCDGVVHVWDVETCKSLSSLSHSWSEQERFNSLSIVTSRCGISPDMGMHGDDQIVTCAGSVLSHYDFRQCSTSSSPSSSSSCLKPISEWKTFLSTSNSSSSDGQSAVQLTCSASHEDYVCAGSCVGMLWVFDRRTGKPLHTWQAHDQAIIKVGKEQKKRER